MQYAFPRGILLGGSRLILLRGDHLQLQKTYSKHCWCVQNLMDIEMLIIYFGENNIKYATTGIIRFIWWHWILWELDVKEKKNYFNDTSS